MLKNKDKIRIYTIDSFFQMLFHKLVAPYHQIYSMKMIETEEENQDYYKKILKHIFSKKDLFEEMKVFFDLSPEKNIENYLLLIKNIIQERWKFLLLQGIHNYAGAPDRQARRPQPRPHRGRARPLRSGRPRPCARSMGSRRRRAPRRREELPPQVPRRAPLTPRLR